MVTHFTTVVIEFVPTGQALDTQINAAFGVWFRLIVSQRKAETTNSLQIEAITLYEGEQPGYVLSPEEICHFVHLLDQIVIKAPWNVAGFAGEDGAEYTLRLRGAKSILPFSDLTFSWWGTAPKEWEHIEAVLAYVIELAKKQPS